MVSILYAYLPQSFLYRRFDSPKHSASGILISQRIHSVFRENHCYRNACYSFCQCRLISKFDDARRIPSSKRGWSSICFSNAGEESKENVQIQESGLDWPILKRWDVPWEWETVSLTSLACGLSFVLTGLVGSAAISYLGLQVDELSLDEKAELLFVAQGITTAVVLGVLYSVFNTFQPLQEDIFCYDLREPFNLQKGWLLWAGIGLVGAIGSIALTGAVTSVFSRESPQRETDALVLLLPLIGSSSISTACLVGITGIFAPLLEETVFRGFFMVSLTKWVPTPVSVLISAALFALTHLTPGEFPQLFVLGTALGFSYAQTRNLLTPITIHAFWNSGVIFSPSFCSKDMISRKCCRHPNSGRVFLHCSVDLSRQI